MKVIWKFELKTVDIQTIEMPYGSEILTIQVQKERPVLYALVYPKAKKANKIIEIFLTGQPITYELGESRAYLGTYQLHGGDLVFHVFEYTGI